jgi:hypothetical protein
MPGAEAGTAAPPPTQSAGGGGAASRRVYCIFEIEWVLPEWAERPAKPRRARVGTYIAANNKAKKEAAEPEVPWWRYQEVAVGARV